LPMSNRFGRFSKKIVAQPFAFYATGFAIGAVAWSGHLWTLPLSLAMIALLPPAQTLKNRFLLAAGYFSGATWTVVPGAAIFYGHDYNPFAIIPLWLGVSFLLAGPWAVLCGGSPKRLLWGVPASLIIESVPPFAPLGLANPLIAAGALFPYTRWFGLLFLAILATVIAIAPRPTIVIVVLLTLLGLAAPDPTPPSNWVAINTNFGGEGLDTPDILRLYKTAETIQRTALESHAQVVIFPESVIYRWNDSTDLFWRPTTGQLQREGKTLIVGANVDLPGNKRYENVAIMRGTVNGTFKERIPMPVSMWRPGTGTGVPSHLFGPGIILLDHQRAAILVCYEQLLVWPVLRSLQERPTLLVGIANDYWARNTYFPTIQTASMRSWSRLFGIPALTAVNQ
jgi:apolipoprotein N-acyltransferase